MSKSNTNVAVISGTLDATPEFDTLQSGTLRARFVIDTVERRGGRRLHNYPHFAVYGEQAKELEAKGLSKGDAIKAEGRLRTGQSTVVVEGETIVYKKTQEPVEWDTTWINVERVTTDGLDGADTNEVKLSGTLNAKVDFTPTRRGTPRARFVIDSVTFRGQEEVHTVSKVTVYGSEKVADLEASGLSKGDAVEVEGALQTRLSTVIVEGEKVVYESGKPVRRKIAWITAEQVVEVDLDARGETSVRVSGEQSETASAGEPRSSSNRFRIRDLFRFGRGQRRSRR
jgi:single-stranded DNA-binding protein